MVDYEEDKKDSGKVEKKWESNRKNLSPNFVIESTKGDKKNIYYGNQGEREFFEGEKKHRGHTVIDTKTQEIKYARTMRGTEIYDDRAGDAGGSSNSSGGTPPPSGGDKTETSSTSVPDWAKRKVESWEGQGVGSGQ
ncbi:MAG: hypothetical protein KGI33_08780 [Thaumarchaeota archaeon]|nr:hypothetical protein [Nitrososphaerota archaeon]